MSLTPVSTKALSTKALQSELDRRGLQHSRGTIAKWIDLGMPKTQPSGENGSYRFDLEAVLSWIDSRCTSPAPGQVA